ncbi:MAG: 6-bladed beta-propeller, partial [Marinilabiliaceae bacterium]|nr:6-bladed beta-propeller [Marinilabiliaceae bacterium]
MEMKWAVFLTFCIFLASCGRENSTDNGIINLEEVINNPGEMKLSKIIDRIEYIRLETTEKSLIGHSYTGISCTSSYIFVAEEDRPLKVFKRDGSFLRSVGKIGRGPGEYSGHCLFNYDHDKDELLILDSFRGEIRRYGIDGTYYGDINGEDIASFGIISGGRICVSYRESVKDSTGIYNYAILDRDGNVLNKYLLPCDIFTRVPIEGTDKFMGYQISPTIYKSGEMLYIDTKQNDTIFTISD